MQDHGQLGLADAGDAQCTQLGCREGRGRCAGVGQRHDLAHDTGQGGQLAGGVHIGGGFQVDHAVEQTDFWCRVDAGRTQELELCLRQRRVVVVAAVSGQQQGVDGIGHGLQLAGAVAVACDHRCQVGIGGGNVGGCHAFHTGHIPGVGGGSGLAAVVHAQLGYGAGPCRVGSGDQGLQFGQGVGAAAVVRLRGQGGQHRVQVVGGHTGQADEREIAGAQGRAGGAACGRELDGIDHAGQCGQFGVRVDFCGAGLLQHIVHQARLGDGVDGGQGHGLVLRSAQRQIVVVGVVGCGQDGQVAVDHALHFGQGVAVGSGNGCKGRVDRGQVASVHTGDARIAVRQQGRDGRTGAAAGVVTDHTQGRALGVDGDRARVGRHGPHVASGIDGQRLEAVSRIGQGGERGRPSAAAIGHHRFEQGVAAVDFDFGVRLGRAIQGGRVAQGRDHGRARGRRCNAVHGEGQRGGVAADVARRIAGPESQAVPAFGQWGDGLPLPLALGIDLHRGDGVAVVADGQCAEGFGRAGEHRLGVAGQGRSAQCGDGRVAAHAGDHGARHHWSAGCDGVNHQLGAGQVGLGVLRRCGAHLNVVGAVAQGCRDVQGPDAGGRVVGEFSAARCAVGGCVAVGGVYQGDTGANHQLVTRRAQSDMNTVASCQLDVLRQRVVARVGRVELERIAAHRGRVVFGELAHHGGHVGWGDVHFQAAGGVGAAVARGVAHAGGHRVGVAVVQRDAVGIGQGHAPVARTHCGGVGLAIEADGDGLAIFSRAGACDDDVGGHAAEVAQGTPFRRVEQACAAAAADNIACDLGHGQCGRCAVDLQGVGLAASVVVAVGATDFHRVGFVRQGCHDVGRQAGGPEAIGHVGRDRGEGARTVLERDRDAVAVEESGLATDRDRTRFFSGVDDVIACDGADGDDRHLRGIRDAHIHAVLQFAERVDAAGVQQFANGQQHASQIGRAHARDAQGRKVGSAQSGRGLSAQGGGHEAADDVGQGLQFAGLVHGGGGLGIDHVAQQARFCGGVDVGQAQQLVLRGAQRHIVVGAVAVGTRQQQMVGVDDGLHFGGRVGGGAGQRCDEAVEACHVATGDAGDACGQVGAVGGSCVAAGVGADHAHGRVEVGHRSGDRSLQRRQAGDATAAVVCGCNARQHGDQVVGGDTGHPDQGQLGGCQCGRGALTGGGLQQAADHSGNGIEFGDGVDLTGIHGADHVVVQGQAVGTKVEGVADGAQGHAQGLVDRLCRVIGRSVSQSAIGFGQHQGVGIDHGLHGSGGCHIGVVHRCAGQRAVDGRQQHGVGRAVGQDQARHTCGGVGGQVGHGAAIVQGVVADHIERCAIGRDAGGDHVLQAAQAGDATAVVGAGGDGSQDRSQVFGRDGAGAQQSVELGCGQSGRGCATGGHHQQAVDCVGQGVEVRDRVHISRTALADQVVEQAQAVGVGRNGAQGNAHRLVGGDRRIDTRSRIRSAAIGLGQDGGVGINDGLHFGGGVHQSSGDGGAGQSRVYGGQQRGVALQAGDACGGVDRFGRGRVGVAVGIADQRAERSRLRGQGVVHDGLQIGQGIDVAQAGRCDGVQNGRQVGAVHAGQAQSAQVLHAQRGRCSAGRRVDQCSDRVGQRLQFAVGVDG